MNDQIKEHIIRDEDFLKLFAIVDLNNNANDQEDDPKDIKDTSFRVLSTDDYEFYDYLLNKWKTCDANKLLEKDLAEHRDKTYTDAELQEALEQLERVADAERGLYYNEINRVGLELTDEFINRTFFVYYDLALRMSFIFLNSLTYYFYFMKKYEDHPLAKTLRGFLDLVLQNEATDPYEDIRHVFKNKNPNKEEFKLFYDSVQTGIAISELIYYSAKGQDFTKDKNEQYYDKYLKCKASYLEEVRDVNDNDEDIASSLKLTLMNYVRVARLFNRVATELEDTIERVGRAYGLNVFRDLTEEELEELSKLRVEKLAEINKMSVAYFCRNGNFKKEATRNLVKIFSLDATTTNMIDAYIEKNRIVETRALDKEPSEVVTGELIEKPIRKSQLRDHSLNDLEPVSKEWNKKNTNEYSTAIYDAHNSIATYNEIGTIAYKEKQLLEAKKKLKDLEKKPNTTQKAIDKQKEVVAEAEKGLATTKDYFNNLEDKIKSYEEDIKDLSEQFYGIDANTEIANEDKPKQKKSLERLIKKKEKDLTLSKKALNNRGLFLQLATSEKGESVITTTDEKGLITLSFRDSEDLLKKFNYESTKLLRYLENIIYDTPISETDNYILIDIDDYTIETGRNPNSYKNVRKQLEEALGLIQNEYFRITGKSKKANITIEGNFVLIDAYFKITTGEERDGLTNNTGKTTFAIHLGKAWRDILLSERAFQWASIPKILNRISNEHIKSLDYTETNVLVVQELGYYLYETLRKGLKGKGYYKRSFKMKTLVNMLIRKGVLQTNKSNRYSKRIINPMKESLNYLEDIGLIEWNSNAFSIYEGDEERKEKGLIGSNEDIIIDAFEKARIDIEFLVYDKETYDRINATNLGHKEKAIAYKEKVKKQVEKKKVEKEVNRQLSLLEAIEETPNN